MVPLVPTATKRLPDHATPKRVEGMPFCAAAGLVWMCQVVPGTLGAGCAVAVGRAAGEMVVVKAGCCEAERLTGV